MQTFLPYSDFAHSASVLDRQRLGKQRVEAMQILNTLLGLSNGWSNHPAVKMWAGYEMALVEYGIAVCHEWRKRGYKDTLEDRFYDMQESMIVDGIAQDSEYVDMPVWLGNRAFHKSHKSNLLRKFPQHYKRYFPSIPDDLPYVWPI